MDEAALRRALRSDDVKSLATLCRVIDNIVTNPTEDKFRMLKLEKKVVQDLLNVPGIETFLCSAGFETSEKLGSLVMPPPSSETLQLLARERDRIKYDLASRAQSEQSNASQIGLPSSTPVEALSQSSIAAVPLEARLIIFDFDGTITINSHVADFGLAGERLQMLSSMADRLIATGTYTVLVTAQKVLTTTIHTVPLLRKSRLDRLFCVADLASDVSPAQLFFHNNPGTAGIYTGPEAWYKARLIQKIMAGENRWRSSFDASQVLFVDDDIQQIDACRSLGIKIRHVQQDGMNRQDVEAVEEFACVGRNVDR